MADVVVAVTEYCVLLYHVVIQLLAPGHLLLQHRLRHPIGIHLLPLFFYPPKTLITHAAQPLHQLLAIRRLLLVLNVD